MKAYEKVKRELHSFLTLQLTGGVGWLCVLAAFMAKEVTLVTIEEVAR